jgi:hypothetical protein
MLDGHMIRGGQDRPMRWTRWGIIAAVVLGACEADRRSNGAANETTGSNDDGTLRVAVQNLYVGADLATLLEARSTAEIPDVVAREFASIEASYFPQRARALAMEIASNPPHLIGLQEVSLFRLQRPGDSPAGNERPAADTVLDFLEVFLDELENEGVAYRTVAAYEGMDIELPSINSASDIDDIRLTDHGVILARTDVAADQPQSINFTTNLGVTVGGEEGLGIELTGGWASVEATAGGSTVLFVTTHLESGDLAPEVQLAQARELLAALDTVTRPVVLVGDFSSTPDGQMTPTYDAVIDAGFIDVWATARPGEVGFTCCQAPDLRNADSALDRRLDFVFYRDAVTRAGHPPDALFEASLIGAASASRTSSGLWPSDHAGISATIRTASSGGG